MDWNYNNPVKIVFSEYFYKEFSTIIKSNSTVLLLCSNRFKKTEDFKKISDTVENYSVFTEIEENPSFESCKRAIDFAFEIKPDLIIAIGGGSVIDTAKIVRMAIYRSTNSIERLIEANIKAVNYLPQFIAITSTHGSSSELTMWATVWDKMKNKKFSVSDKINYPDFAIYDSKLFNSLPIDVSIITSLDALSHSFEALWNKNSNPISDDFALNAIKKIVENIGGISELTPLKTRENLILASIYAGLAFSNTKTGAAHSISYPLTLKYNIPHGIACFMPLFPLLKINGYKIKKKNR